MATVRSMVSKRSRARVEQAQPAPCACDQQRVCGWHYSMLDDYQQAQARKRAGITFGHGNGR